MGIHETTTDHFLRNWLTNRGGTKIGVKVRGVIGTVMVRCRSVVQTMPELAYGLPNLQLRKERGNYLVLHQS